MLVAGVAPAGQVCRWFGAPIAKGVVAGVLPGTAVPLS